MGRVGRVRTSEALESVAKLDMKKQESWHAESEICFGFDCISLSGGRRSTAVVYLGYFLLIFKKLDPCQSTPSRRPQLP